MNYAKLIGVTTITQHYCVVAYLPPSYLQILRITSRGLYKIFTSSREAGYFFRRLGLHVHLHTILYHSVINQSTGFVFGVNHRQVSNKKLTRLSNNHEDGYAAIMRINYALSELNFGQCENKKR